MARKAVFSEGRGLRAHTARHHGLRKVSSMGEDRREAGCPTGTCLDQARAFLAGVRSPPLRGEAKRRREGLTGANPGMARKAVFSEGRGLRAHTARHHGLRKVSSMGEDRREAGCPTGTCLDQARAFLAGVRSPPLRGGAKRRREGLTGANPGMALRAVFSEGRTLCVRMVWPNVCRGIPFSRDGRAKPGHPRGHARVEPIPFPRACGARSFGKASSLGCAFHGAKGCSSVKSYVQEISLGEAGCFSDDLPLGMPPHYAIAPPEDLEGA